MSPVHSNPIPVRNLPDNKFFYDLWSWLYHTFGLKKPSHYSGHYNGVPPSDTLKPNGALADVVLWIEHWPVNQRVKVQSLAWVAGQVPSRGTREGTRY